MIDASIILDSINTHNNSRIVTFVLTYPRFIHAQLMTHRVFSRNVSSSRAIPTKNLVASIRENPVVPVQYGRNKRGMYADEELDREEQEKAEETWKSAMECAISHAEKLASLGLHKQHANRLLEPFMHVKVILTGTEFDNFFNLRINYDVQPEMHMLASLMQQAMLDSSPTPTNIGNWHIPFLTQKELEEYGIEEKLITSVARCARVSYELPGTTRNSTLEDDTSLFARLKNNMHLSPFEHQAVAMPGDFNCANFSGWLQFRHADNVTIS